MEYYIVDAFTDRLFSGNPAGVCVVERWPTAELMQRIAAENNLAETAFVMKTDEGYAIRWFTPEWEMDLCGHATLAGAWVVLNRLEPHSNVVHFTSQSGPLAVERRQELYRLDFPARPPCPVELTDLMREVFNVPVLEAHKSRDFMFVLPDEAAVRAVRPNLQLAATIPDCVDLMVTAPGDDADFVSRFFTPGVSIPEDPVTGSAHCTLIPYWAGRLGKQSMLARQLSARGGTLHCQLQGQRVGISGAAILYLSGELHI